MKSTLTNRPQRQQGLFISLMFGCFSTLTHGAESVPDMGAGLETGQLLQVVLGLVAVLLLIGGLAWVARNLFRFQPGMSGELRILGGLSMGPRERLVLVKVGGEQLLLGVAPGRIQTLHVLEHPIKETPPGAEPVKGFTAQLTKALQQGRKGDA